MLERNRFMEKAVKTQPWPRLWVQWPDTSPRKYFSGLSNCHSSMLALVTGHAASAKPGSVPQHWESQARSGEEPLPGSSGGPANSPNRCVF